MTYLVTDNCVKCKHTDCVEVCPVDCFYEVDDMLVINPLECIDCGVCEPECPVDAIIPDNAISGEEHDRWYAINEQLSETGVNITEKLMLRQMRQNTTVYLISTNSILKKVYQL